MRLAQSATLGLRIFSSELSDDAQYSLTSSVSSKEDIGSFDESIIGASSPRARWEVSFAFFRFMESRFVELPFESFRFIEFF